MRQVRGHIPPSTPDLGQPTPPSTPDLGHHSLALSSKIYDREDPEKQDWPLSPPKQPSSPEALGSPFSWTPDFVTDRILSPQASSCARSTPTSVTSCLIQKVHSGQPNCLSAIFSPNYGDQAPRVPTSAGDTRPGVPTISPRVNTPFGDIDPLTKLPLY